MKVMICCSAGMSTNLLLSKMIQSVRQRALDVEIEAIPEAEINERLKDCDVFLLGPQIRYRFNSVKMDAEPYGIPVAIIDTVKYAKMDGQAVLDQALDLYKKSKE